MKHFPFDTQSCALKFGSWTYDSKKVNLTSSSDGKLDQSLYIENNEFHLISSSLLRHEEVYSTDDGIYIDFECFVKLKRKSGFYVQVDI